MERDVQAFRRFTVAMQAFGDSCRRESEKLRRITADINDTMNTIVSRQVLRAMFPPK